MVRDLYLSSVCKKRRIIACLLLLLVVVAAAVVAVGCRWLAFKSSTLGKCHLLSQPLIQRFHSGGLIKLRVTRGSSYSLLQLVSRGSRKDGELNHGEWIRFCNKNEKIKTQPTRKN